MRARALVHALQPGRDALHREQPLGGGVRGRRDVVGPMRDCDVAAGEACRGGRCVVLCNDDSVLRTNIGCEYYGVDLDNIVENGRALGGLAAVRRGGVNPDPVLTTRVECTATTPPPGMPRRPSAWRWR